MSLPAEDELRRLLEWQPRGGVLSVCVRVDHADRGGGWRIALRDSLREALRDAPAEIDSDDAEATAKRVLDELGRNGDTPPDGRGLVVFAEVGSRPGEQRRYETMATPRADAVAMLAPRPHLQPLVELLDDYRPRGVVIVSGERARVLDWREGELEDLAEREIVTTGDWRERKAPRNVDIPSGQIPSSSGHDQHEQRLDDHRRRFVSEIGDEVREATGRRGWRELICFGEAEWLSVLLEALRDGTPRVSEEKNLIPAPTHEILDRLQSMLAELNRRREHRLIELAEQQALAGGQGSLGLTETAQALAEGRADHLIIAPAELPEVLPEELLAALETDEGTARLPAGELMIERAILTGASVTPVEDEAAERLAEREGVAAILRY